MPQALRDKTLASFMLQDLRRFVVFDSSALKPYIVSAVSNWARAERLGYIRLEPDGKVRPYRFTALRLRTDPLVQAVLSLSESRRRANPIAAPK